MMGFAGGERLALHLSLPFAYRRGWGGRQTGDLMRKSSGPQSGKVKLTVNKSDLQEKVNTEKISPESYTQSALRR